MTDMQEGFVRIGRNAYRSDEVDAYVLQTKQQMLRLEEEKSSLESKLILLAQKVEEYRADEDSLRAALLGAQRFGDNIVKESKQKAETMISEAQLKAAQIEDAAQAQADSVLSNLRSDQEKEKKELARLQKETARFREQLKSLYLAQLASVEKLPGEDLPDEPEEAAPQPAPASTVPAEDAITISVEEALEEEVTTKPYAPVLATEEEDDLTDDLLTGSFGQSSNPFGI